MLSLLLPLFVIADIGNEFRKCAVMTIIYSTASQEVRYLVFYEFSVLPAIINVDDDVKRNIKQTFGLVKF